LTLMILSTVAGLAYHFNRPKAPPVPAAEPAVEAAPAPPEEVGSEPPPVHVRQELSGQPSTPPVAPVRDKEATAPIPGAKLEQAMLNPTIDLLVSSQTGYGQKQATWRQLRESGNLDPVIGELERKMTSDPSNADCAAALGQAYWQKAGTIKDVREQAIFAMQADRLFDTALSLDSANWEARFTKAVGLTYWPPTLNKGDEAIQQFLALIQQQENQSPQPEFAETYVRLGDQYQKGGHGDDARAVWERGATLFPSHEGLKTKLASAR